MIVSFGRQIYQIFRAREASKENKSLQTKTSPALLLFEQAWKTASECPPVDFNLKPQPAKLVNSQWL
uniref:Uncharacterized protein n=1 Tax=Physcomitrium patens TaxID=3218 RepID=A0A2K1K874_PHYPA|nr:hypothetical protein PHYPA_011881 [Physcomitrium patens]